MRTIIIILKKKQANPKQSFPDAALVICLSEGFSFRFFNFAVGFAVLTLRAVIWSDLRCYEHWSQEILVSVRTLSWLWGGGDLLHTGCKGSLRLAHIRTGAVWAPGWLVSGSPIPRSLGWFFFASLFSVLKLVGPTILEPWPQLGLSLFSSVFWSERKALSADCYIRKNPKEVLGLPGWGHLPSPDQQLL